MKLGAREGQAAFGLHLEAFRCVRSHTDHDAAGLARLDDAAELAVIERDLGADRQTIQHVGRFAHRLDRRVGGKRRGIGHEPEPVAGHDALAWLPLDLADAKLGSGDVHQHGNAASHRITCRAGVLNHRGPGVGAVMRAVYADDIGAAPRDLQHERGILRRLGRESDHDPPGAVGLATEQGLRVGMQLHLATKELFVRRQPVWGRVSAGHQCAQSALHGTQREQYAAFQSAE